jgi:hypothetical protein
MGPNMNAFFSRAFPVSCLASVALIVTCFSAGAASTLLFSNLTALAPRLKTGDPALQSTDGNGVIVDGPKDIAVADLDADGHADIAVANKDGTVTVYFGQGGAQFTTPLHLHTGGGQLRGLVLADLTGDGRRDLAVGAPYDGLVAACSR